MEIPTVSIKRTIYNNIHIKLTMKMYVYYIYTYISKIDRSNIKLKIKIKSFLLRTIAKQVTRNSKLIPEIPLQYRELLSSMSFRFTENRKRNAFRSQRWQFVRVCDAFPGNILLQKKLELIVKTLLLLPWNSRQPSTILMKIFRKLCNLSQYDS